jgi:hypothetical protein
MTCSRGGGEETSLSVCMEEGRNAVDLEPLCPLFLLASTLLTQSYLTLPFPWSRDAGAELPANPEVELPTAVMQIRLPGTRSGVPPLSELAPSRSIASSPPQHPRGTPGEPPHPAWPPLGFPPCSCGRRKKTDEGRRS